MHYLISILTHTGVAMKFFRAFHWNIDKIIDSWVLYMDGWSCDSVRVIDGKQMVAVFTHGDVLLLLELIWLCFNANMILLIDSLGLSVRHMVIGCCLSQAMRNKHVFFIYAAGNGVGIENLWTFPVLNFVRHYLRSFTYFCQKNNVLLMLDLLSPSSNELLQDMIFIKYFYIGKCI